VINLSWILLYMVLFIITLLLACLVLFLFALAIQIIHDIIKYGFGGKK